MGWFDRTGAARPLADAARRDPSIRKANGPARMLTAGEIADEYDALMSSLGGGRVANMDFRGQQLAKHEAAERWQVAVQKAEHDKAATYVKPAFVLPSEERKRQASLPSKSAPQAAGKATEALGSSIPSASATPLQVAQTVYYDAQEALLWLLKQQARDDDDDDGGGTPPAAPVTDSSVRQNDQGVYAKRDRRTVTTHHTVNRKIGKSGIVQKSAHSAFLDLANPFTWARPA